MTEVSELRAGGKARFDAGEGFESLSLAAPSLNDDPTALFHSMIESGENVDSKLGLAQAQVDYLAKEEALALNRLHTAIDSSMYG